MSLPLSLVAVVLKPLYTLNSVLHHAGFFFFGIIQLYTNAVVFVVIVCRADASCAWFRIRGSKFHLQHDFCKILFTYENSALMKNN